MNSIQAATSSKFQAQEAWEKRMTSFFLEK